MNKLCVHCKKNPVTKGSNAEKYSECETCFYAEGFSSPATRIAKKDKYSKNTNQFR